MTGATVVGPPAPSISLSQALGGGIFLFTVATFWVRPYVPVVGLFLSVVVLVVFGAFGEGRMRTTWGLGLILLYACIVAFPSFLYDDLKVAARVAPTAALAGMAWSLLRCSRRYEFGIVCVLVAACVCTVVLMWFQVAPGEFSFSLVHALTRERGNYYLTGSEPHVGPTMIAPLIGIGMLGSLFAIFEAGSRAGRLLASVATAFFFFMLVLTGSRIALVAGTISALCLITLIKARLGRFRLRSLLTLPFILVVVCVLAVLAFEMTLTYSPGAVERYSTLLTATPDLSLRGRFRLWEEALDAANTNILGNGFTAFPDRYGNTPHNEYLGHLVAGGILGLLALLAVIGAWAYRVLYAIRLCRGWARHVAAFSGSCLLFAVGIGTMENYSVSSLSLFWFIFWLLASHALTRVQVPALPHNSGGVRGRRDR